MAQPTKEDITNLTNAIKDLTANIKKGGKAAGGSTSGGSSTGGRTSIRENGTKAQKAELLGRYMSRSKNPKMKAAGSALAKGGKAAGSLAKGLKGGPWGIILEAVGAAAKKAVEMYNKVADYNLKLEVIDKKKRMATMNYYKDTALKTVDLQKQVASSFQDARFGALTDAFANSLSIMTKGINEAAFSQLRSQRASAVSLKKANINKQIAENTYTQEIKEMSTNYSAEIANLDAEERQAKAEFKADMIEGATSALSIIPGVESAGEAVSGAMKGAAQRDVERTAINQEVIKTEAQLTQVNTQAANATLELSIAQIEAADKINQATEALTQVIEGLVLTTEKATNRMGIEYGYSGEQLETFKRGMLSTSLTLTAFGKTMEDAQRWQSAYIEGSGRAVNFSNSDFENMASIDYLFGEDGMSARLSAGMNIFNTSIQSGSELLADMYNKANKMGVSNKKFAKDLEKSLKQAQKYQFKGGVEGVAKMALWAQKVRFNMDEMDSILDKMHTGNIEDVMQTSAKLNVLGGNAGLLSDPMGMLFNAYANPEQYMKNINDMIAGFGHFNKRTGETEFNINEQMRIEAIAAATGESKENLMNQARQKNKSKVLDNLLGNKYTEEQRALIDSKATYNKKEKRWEVGIWDAASGKYVNQDVTKLSKGQLESLSVEANDKDLPQYVKDIRDWVFKLDAEKMREQNVLMNSTYGTIIDEFGNRLAESESNFKANMDKNIEDIENTSKAATAALETGNKVAMDARAQLKGTADDISDAAFNIATELQNAANVISNAMGTLSDYESGGALGMTAASATDALNKYSKNATNEGYLDKWEDAIDAAQNADLTNGLGQYNNKDFMSNGFAWFDDNGNMYVNLSKKTGFEGGDDVYTMIDKIRSEGYTVDGRTGKVTKTGDLIIDPEYGVYETRPDDIVTAQAPNGPIARSKGEQNSMPENLNLTINGSLRLDSSKFSIDILELLRNDPRALRELSKEIVMEVSRTTFGGKSQWAPNRYTFGN